MKALFVDTWFWIALINSNDHYHQQAKELKASLVECYVVTTEEVLVELLTYFSPKGRSLRLKAIRWVKEIINSDVEIIPQSHDSFLSGLMLYEQRPDKGYSLTDCISMQTMKAMTINEVLTHDRHFIQEGFKNLLK